MGMILTAESPDVNVLKMGAVQDASLLQFQRRFQRRFQANNLSSTFGVQRLPVDPQLRSLLDRHDYAPVLPVFANWVGRLQRNLRFNLLAGADFVGADPAYSLLWWFGLAGGGLSVLCLAGALRTPRRYALLLGLVALVLVTHSVPAHKGYRFIFALIPLWLLIGSDLAARAQRAGGRRRARPPHAGRSLRPAPCSLWCPAPAC